MRAGGQRERHRRKTARASHGQRLSRDDAHHGVVVAREDGAVVSEQRVGDTARNQVLPGQLVIHLDGFLGEVAARHHERVHTPLLAGGEQEVL